jgi:hypothetical protein
MVLSSMETTRRQALAQLLFCEGCCCGRTDRGKPELPVERLKTAWREHKLNRVVQLTISGCLGPCDKTNVTLLLTRGGQRWIGNISGDADYDALIAWAVESAAGNAMMPLPERFHDRVFERWTSEAVA